MIMPIHSNDERTVEQATALARANGYRLVGRVINGEPCFVLVKRF